MKNRIASKFIDVFALLELGSKVAKQELSIADLFPLFRSNKLFVIH